MPECSQGSVRDANVPSFEVPAPQERTTRLTLLQGTHFSEFSCRLVPAPCAFIKYVDNTDYVTMK